MKRFISLLLFFAVTLSLATSTFAASPEAMDAANALYQQGLFSGTGGTDANGNPNFELDRAPTRYEAVTMLVRLLGKADEAQNTAWNTPFTDVADWAKPYVGYAYANGLTSGTSDTTYGGDQKVTASEYLTFALCTLGYKAGIDFHWNKAWELSDQIGLTDGRYNADTTSFTRGDVAIISHKLSTLSDSKPSETPSDTEMKPDTSSTTAPPEIKLSIMEHVVAGLKAIKNGTENAATADKFMAFENMNYAMECCKNVAANSQTVIDEYNTAISLCADYSDTQTVKAALIVIRDSWSSLLSFPAYTEQAIDTYIDDVLAVIEKSLAFNDIIVGEIERWTDD